ncbi:hypothetical protein HYPSUDRAFT_54085 [Hypholoma sublateritium FD-334 SS-4]|uniref:Uncharacterized protein n=1 Tax=Hypholoma sublateritium (strain FD-334 SS-4) TaxID=945553 RepID=A0A0D2MJN3_HYPSF|nr:hypothetical protein HYPSUDRAFT_54085 [Hypholoma sublateritium FD-334 SS-4]
MAIKNGCGIRATETELHVVQPARSSAFSPPRFSATSADPHHGHARARERCAASVCGNGKTRYDDQSFREDAFKVEIYDHDLFLELCLAERWPPLFLFGHGRRAPLNTPIPRGVQDPRRSLHILCFSRVRPWSKRASETTPSLRRLRNIYDLLAPSVVRPTDAHPAVQRKDSIHLFGEMRSKPGRSEIYQVDSILGALLGRALAAVYVLFLFGNGRSVTLKHRRAECKILEEFHDSGSQISLGVLSINTLKFKLPRSQRELEEE